MMKKLSYKYCNNEEAIDICTNTLLKNAEKVEGLSKIEFNKILYLVTKESYFIFNGHPYKQVDESLWAHL